jgi:hypothetical protein
MLKVMHTPQSVRNMVRKLTKSGRPGLFVSHARSHRLKLEQNHICHPTKDVSSASGSSDN